MRYMQEAKINRNGLVRYLKLGFIYDVRKRPLHLHEARIYEEGSKTTQWVDTRSSDRRYES